MLYRGKEEIYSEIKTYYKLKWHSPTNIISHALWVLRPKLVFLQKKHGVLYTFALPEVTWYEPLYHK